MERYFIMIVSVLVFYVLVKRNGFSKNLALAAFGFVALIFGTIIVKGAFSATMIMEILPWFFMSYCIFYFIMFCLRKSASSLTGMKDMHSKRRRFKESRKVATTNKNVKTYKGAKRKKSKMLFKEDTIAAIATAPGEGGIGIIRISGSETFSILEKVFVPVRIKKDKIQNRRMTYGKIVNSETGKEIDEVMVVFMKAPYTYTKEDVAEIQCHGNVVSLRNILALVLRAGARIAEPGEFTKRAFLNGRLDLSQAEAVIDLIRAKTDTGFDSAMGQLSGNISNEIAEIRNALLTLLGDITVNIEYPDEDIEEITYEALIDSLSQISDMIKELLSTSETGKIIKEGLKVAIVGKPNVGKSSLMNALLRENRAIVTEIPGTTRDTIEETINVRGIPICLTDTAGIRETQDKIEKIGIEKSRASLLASDLIIFMMDGSVTLTAEDYGIIENVNDKPVLVLVNKEDLGIVINVNEIEKRLPSAKIVKTSMSKGEGINETEDIIEELVYGGNIRHENSVLITNARHKDLLEKSKSSIDDAMKAARLGEPLDIVEIDAKEAYELLGQIVGESVSGDIIENVFSRFCLGK